MDKFIQLRYGYVFFDLPTKPGENASIYKLYVHPEFRRKGYSRRLLNYVKTEIQNEGYTGPIDIEVRPFEWDGEGKSINTFTDSKWLKEFYTAEGLNVIN